MGLVHRIGWDPQLCERSPWFWPLEAAASHLRQHADWPSLRELANVYRVCTDGLDVPRLVFSENVRKQDKRARGRVVLSALYDARITLAREVPTRERDWHDLLNMLCFATFPRSKIALHARQYARLAERVHDGMTTLPNRRTPEQDALTLFDEGGVVLAVEQQTAAQLERAPEQARDALAVELNAARRVRVVPFGHALYEHLVEGLRCPGGCTQVVVVPQLWVDPAVFLRTVDEALARRLADPSCLQSPRACGQVRLASLEL